MGTARSNDIMNNAVTGWRRSAILGIFQSARRQKGWERIRNDSEHDSSMDGFQEIPTEEMEQLGLSEEWLKQNKSQLSLRLSSRLSVWLSVWLSGKINLDIAALFPL